MTPLSKLRTRLIESFDIEELRTLCFDLGIDYDSLRGEGKAAKARDLILYMTRQKRLDDLLAACKTVRPEVDWPDQVTGTQLDANRPSWWPANAWQRLLIVIIPLVILGTALAAVFNQNQNETGSDPDTPSANFMAEKTEAAQIPSPTTETVTTEVVATVSATTLTIPATPSATLPPAVTTIPPSPTTEPVETPIMPITLTPVPSNQLNDAFQVLLNSSPAVEDIRAFASSNRGILEAVPQSREGDIAWGTLPSFPITEGIVPDFTVFVFQVDFNSQLINYIVFVQFLPPTAVPFTVDSALSPSLQTAVHDAAVYLEAAVAHYDDYAQRLLDDDRFFLPAHGLTGYFPPEFQAVIVIGRREALGKSDISQIQEMNAGDTKITVVTYDTLLDYLNALPGSNGTN